MRTIKEVIKDHGCEKLIKSILKEVGRDSFQDIYEHGADAGFSGITYTWDCCQLAWKNREEIRMLIEDYSCDFGEEIGEMLQSWKCIGKDYRQSELLRSFYRESKPTFEDDADRALWNGLAWFAAEEVARWFCD